MNEQAQVHQFIEELLKRNGDESSFADSEPLITHGRLQSVDTLEVLLFLEERYGVDFGESGFDQNQVDSVDNIMALIASSAAK